MCVGVEGGAESRAGIYSFNSSFRKEWKGKNSPKMLCFNGSVLHGDGNKIRDKSHLVNHNTE